MSDKNANKGGSSNTVLKTVAGVAIGGLLAAAAYFVGKNEGREETQHQYQARVARAQNMTPRATDNVDKKADDDDKLVRECDICMRSFKKLMEADEEIHTTPCGHVFCKVCIDQALTRDAKCPICRQQVHPNQTLRIFL